jgi:hypothetical protein
MTLPLSLALEGGWNWFDMAIEDGDLIDRLGNDFLTFD